MARKITMFELHFDGIRFGRSDGAVAGESLESAETTGDTPELADSLDESVATADEMDQAQAASSGSRTRRILAVIGAVGLAWMAGRRAVRRFREGVEMEREMDGDVELSGEGVESSGQGSESAEITAER